MSKPTKKSDANKNWMKSRKDTSKAVNINPEYHLIVSEGTDTEPNYFEAVKNEINSKYRNHIKLQIEGLGDNTVNLFYRAKNKNKKSLNGYKHVWIVYDTDSFPAEHINLTAELCRNESTDETTYHALWSNQCIELWFLLHFALYQSDIHRAGYFPKLTEYLLDMGVGEYKKNREDIYKVLKPKLKTAIVNAKKLAEINEGKTPANSAPGTEIHKLMEELLVYLDV